MSRERPVIYCPKGGIHSDEQIQLVCLDPICRNDNLCCIICKKEKHQFHKTVLLKTFYEDLSYKSKAVDRQGSIHFQQSMDDTMAQVEQSFTSFKKYILLKLQKYEQRMVEYFQNVSKHNNCFQGFDIQGLRYESDPYLLQKSINVVLDNVQMSKDGQKINKVDETFFGAERYHTNYSQFSQHFVQSLKKIHNLVSEEYKKLLQFQENGEQKLTNISMRQNQSTVNLNQSFSKLTPFSQTVESQFVPPQQQQRLNQQFSQMQRQPSGSNFDQTPNQFLSQSQNFINQGFPQPQAPSQLNFQQSSNGFSQLGQNDFNQQQSQQAFFNTHQRHSSQIYQDVSQMNLSQLSQKASVVVEENGTIKSGPDFNIFDQNRFNNRSLTPNQSIIQSNQFQRQHSQIRQDRSKSPLQIQNVHRSRQEERLYQAENRNSSMGRILEFKYSTIMKHVNIDVVQHRRVARVTSDNHDSRMILLEPSIEARPLREISITFKILNCKNIAYTAPLAIGVCHQKFIETNGYQFIGDDQTSSGYQDRNPRAFKHSKTLSSFKTSSYKNNVSSYRQPSEHGSYLVSSNGIIRNQGDPSQDMRKSQMRFQKGDTVIMSWNPFKKTLTFTRVDSNQQTVLKNVNISGDKLHACVRLSYSTDSVSIE